MAKKATSKTVTVAEPTLDPLEDAIPTTSSPVIQNDPLDDDDPFSSGVEGAIKPVRSEPEDELSMTTLNELDDEKDDFGQVFLQKDKEISDEFLKKVDEAVSGEVEEEKLGWSAINSIKGDNNTNIVSENIDTFGHDKIISEYEEKITLLSRENTRLKEEILSLPKLSPVTISDQFDQLYQSLKEGRAAELLLAVQKDYLDLKYHSYTDKEKEEIRLILKDALRERFEGKVRAAKLIHKQDSKVKP